MRNKDFKGVGEMKLNKKTIIIIGSVVLVVIIAVVLFFVLGSNPKETNGNNSNESGHVGEETNANDEEELGNEDLREFENGVADYSVALSRLKNAGIIDSQFDNVDPNKIIKRATFLKVLFEAESNYYSDGLEYKLVELKPTTTFSDISENHWANKYIAYFEEDNAIEEKLEFKPEDFLLFEDAIKWIVKKYSDPDIAENSGGTFEAYFQSAEQSGYLEYVSNVEGDEVNYFTVMMFIYNIYYERA